MNWFEQYRESLEIPAIGSPEWYECIPAQHRAGARQLVDAGTPVCIIPSGGTGFKVVFDATEFVAGAFVDHSAADRYAATWNNRNR